MTKSNLIAALEAIPEVPDNAPVEGFNWDGLTREDFAAYLNNPAIPSDAPILTINQALTQIVDVTGIVFEGGILVIQRT